MGFRTASSSSSSSSSSSANLLLPPFHTTCRREAQKTDSNIRRYIILFLTTLVILHTEGIEWLAVAKRRENHWNRTSDCMQASTEGMTKQQRKYCSRNLELMSSVVHASLMTAQVCQELFLDSRWNCSSILLAPKFMPDLNGGSREQAVVYALASASLTQSIAKFCSSGNTNKCHCGRQPHEAPTGDFKWGGCSDDVRFGVAFTQNFADTPWNKTKDKAKRSMMNLHNSRVGRKAMTDSLSTTCKCHGVSGSCSMRTCWKSLADMRTVGASLLKSYALAVEVENRKQGKTKNRKLVPVLDIRANFSDSELIYYNKSPDYCLPEASLGSVGTKGRECQKDQDGSSGCKSMCCGRGFSSEIVDIQYRCDCKYYWCCYVKCKTCTKTVEVSRCR
uniref:Protein Wnt n=1 Tax=Perionyx excavatus TaxID=168854 RepID=D5LLN2_9ANNE|nr:WNT11 [Perionyx excavatus]